MKSKGQYTETSSITDYLFVMIVHCSPVNSSFPLLSGISTSVEPWEHTRFFVLFILGLINQLSMDLCVLSEFARIGFMEKF